MPEPIQVQQPGELLAFLFSVWPAEKKKQIRIWLKFKAVTVNGRPVTQYNHPLRMGDTVCIRQDNFAQPGDKLIIGIRILHEDAAILVIEKPPGLLSIASASEQDRTVYSHLMDHVRQGPKAARERVWIVHRLDKETSGLMVFAKTELAKQTLQQSWSESEKRYYAVVTGYPMREMGRIESHLDETAPHKVFSSVQNSRTRLAVTQYQVVKKGNDNSLLEVVLETGRRHQIRVQLADLGCPIVGDTLYGKKTNPRFNRLALHAHAIRFRHPITGSEMRFSSPLPAEIGKLIAPKSSSALLLKAKSPG